MKVPWDIIHFFPNETIWLNMKAVIAMLLIVLFSCSPPRARHGGKILTAVAAGSKRGDQLAVSWQQRYGAGARAA